MLAFYVVLHFFLPIKTHIDHEMVFCCAPILEIRYFLQCILYQLYQNNVGMNCHHSSFSLRNFSFYSLDVVCCCVVFSFIFCLCFCEFNLMIKSLHIDAIYTRFVVEFENLRSVPFYYSFFTNLKKSESTFNLQIHINIY